MEDETSQDYDDVCKAFKMSSDSSSSIWHSEQVNVRGGDSWDTFSVHRHLLASKAPYIEHQLQSARWESLQHPVLAFSSFGYDTVELFVCWLYTSDLERAVKKGAARFSDNLGSSLVRAHLLGHTFQVYAFSDSCSHVLIRWWQQSTCGVTESMIWEVFAKNKHTDDALRLLLLDLCLVEMQEVGRRFAPQLPAKFLSALVNRLADVSSDVKQVRPQLAGRAVKDMAEQDEISTASDLTEDDQDDGVFLPPMTRRRGQ